MNCVQGQQGKEGFEIITDDPENWVIRIRSFDGECEGERTLEKPDYSFWEVLDWIYRYWQENV